MENGFGDQGVTAEAANVTAMNDVLSAAADVPVDKEKPQVGSVRCSTSTSRHSDASTHSFAFPILAEGDGSIKVEPESQTQQQVKAAEDKEAPKVAPDAANSKWFPYLSCSFCC